MIEAGCRLLEIDVNSYAEATMSLSPAIAKACEEGKVPETLAMFTHRKPSIVMGRQNDPDVDLNYGYCLEEGIIVKRVPTPGTIFGHPGYVMNALYIQRERVPEAIPDVFAMMNRQLASAFSNRWGLMARHRPINDLEVQTGGIWKKVGPFSISFFGPFICCRMGLTITPIPFETVEAAVPGPPEKFSDKKEKSVSARVGSLEEALGHPVKIDEVKEIVRKSISELFQMEFYPGTLSEIEERYEQELRDLYDNETWFWGNSVQKRFPYIPDGASFFELSEKIPQGPLIRARILKRHDEILDCSLTGWYHGVRPLDALERVESSLKGVSCQEEMVLSRIEKAYKDGNIEIDQCTPKQFKDVIFKALERPISKNRSN